MIVPVKKWLAGGRKGFTLIELLIVIAILGVLAAVVLIVINPVQQMARARDGGRINTVAQLGRAVQAYYTGNNNTLPASWQELVDSGEIKQLPATVSNSLSTPCTGGIDQTNGWCYDADAATGNFAVWSALESAQNLTIGSCTGSSTSPTYAAYLSQAGRTCIVCSEPSAATDESACQN